MEKTVQGLLQHCKDAKDWKYVYGAKGKVLNTADIQKLQNMYGTRMVWKSDLKKAGNVCCDCSGLISSYTGVVRNSTNFINTCRETASIAQLQANWSKYVGWCIWKQGHIGVVSDTPGYYYAMDGSSRNWVHRPLKDNKWTKVGKLCDIKYYAEQATVQKVEQKPIVIIQDTTKTDVAKKFNKAVAGTYKTTTGLNLRVGASTNKSIICTLPKNTSVHCYGYYNLNGITKWLYVKVTLHGVTYIGYASSKYLAK